ncbi:hypothetical protein [Leclercia adecarboxylata]|uniref:hypothetical protein n=1 Tax=Leclercia adecarboxylata TaxID=83655 RepID=UPI00124E55EC|nr:hypothetical protein [Leclercia adecarboxylata]QFH48705.1 hypothetical protein FR819_05265 [Leclercia adecarboxylata]
MSENKILAQVAASLKTVSDGANTLNDNAGRWAEEFRYRMYLESLLKIEVAVMEAALNRVLDKVRLEEEYRKLIQEMETEFSVEQKR